MRESTIEKYICSKLEEMGIMSIKFRGSGRGAPDRINLCKGGKTFFIEFKRPGEKIRRPEQIQWRVLLEHSGFEVFEVSSKDWIEKTYKKIQQTYCAPAK